MVAALLALALSAAPSPSRVVVMPIQAGEAISDKAAAALTDVLAAEVGKRSGADVVTSQDIASVLSLERQKRVLGCETDGCMAELGGALGASRIVTGTVARLGESLLFHLRVIATARAKVEASASRRFKGGGFDDLLDALPAMVAEILAPVSAAPPPPPAPPRPGAGPAAEPRPAPPPAANPFVHAVGTGLADGQGHPLVLRALGFSGQVYANPAEPSATDHGAAEFKLARALGFNAVRLYLNVALFEDDARPHAYKAGGFAWVDRNVAWAREAGLLLILDLHVAPGGDQPAGKGAALWRDRGLRARLVALWKELARRYRDEPVIAAYDILDEPAPVSDVREWAALAGEVVAAVRSADPRHALIVQRAAAVMRGDQLDWREDQNGELNFVRVDDANVIYGFHFFKPFAMTLQGAAWLPEYAGVRASYPGTVRDSHGNAELASRGYLERELAPYVELGKRHRVPMMVVQFGATRTGFEERRNAEGWVADMLDVLAASGTSFSYHVLHESSFGLFRNEGTYPPADPNRALLELFPRKLK